MEIELPAFLPRTPREPPPDLDAAFERGRQAGLEEARAASEAQLASLQPVELADLVAQLMRATDQPARVLQHHQALLGRRQLLARAVHQQAPGAVLQRLDAAAEGRLRKAHRVRRRHEAAVLGKRDQVAKLA